MKKTIENFQASVHDRLMNIARQKNLDFQSVLQYYAMERFLYRLSQTDYANTFILKGGLLLNAWDLPLRRLTKDIDFRGFTHNSAQNIREIFQQVCQWENQADSLAFDPESLSIEVTQVNADYDGIRAHVTAFLGRSRIPVQIDIGFSDEITQKPVRISYPCFLQELPPPTLLGYPPQTVVAEKMHAIIWLGEATSRLKDYYDLWLLSENLDFDGVLLQKAIEATFRHRQTEIPVRIPRSLMDEFAERNQSEWVRTVIRRNKLDQGKMMDFVVVVGRLREFLQPPMQGIIAQETFSFQWKAGNKWVGPVDGSTKLP